MKLEFKTVDDIEKAIGLLGTIVTAGMSVYSIVTAAIKKSGDINTEDKAKLLEKLESMKLPKWEEL